jgi:diguanylate cyclase (GGDEF)-like protein
MEWKIVPGTGGIPVHSLQMTPEGDLWIGTSSTGVGLIRAHSSAVDWFGEKQGLTGKLAFTIRFDRRHWLWAATEAGVFAAKPPYVRFSRIAELPATWFWTVAEGADGTLWAGGEDGLFAFTSGTWQHWNRANGLSNQAVVSLGATPDGSVWIGYEHGGGIDRIHLAHDAATPGGAVIEKGLQRPGSDGLIYFLDFDRAGRLWAGTEKGVDVWDGAHWSHYDTSDGLIWDDCDLGGFATGPDGAIWLGTSGGLSRFKPSPDASVVQPLSVVFTDLRMGGADIFAERNPSLAMSAGALTARFAAPNAARDSSLRFRYQLYGAKSSWTETPQRQLEFANLAPGSYRLEVQARDRLGQWSPQGASFAFSIKTPWYRAMWFVVLLLLIPLIGVSIAFRLRALGARERELRLQLIVNEKTRDLRQANEELLRLTMLDPLTGLANRRRFDQTLAQECERLKRSGSTVSLILLDVDYFKSLNDSAGHQKGDEYLVMLGRELIRAARRQSDLAARIGGEEFALILPATTADQAAAVAESVRKEIEALGLPHPASPTSPSLTVSAGVACATKQLNLSVEELVAAADHALYQAKSLGRNRIHVDRLTP